MTKKKLPQFELTTEGEITNVTFHYKESVEFIEKLKETYKSLAENSEIAIVFMDKDGNYTQLKNENND